MGVGFFPTDFQVTFNWLSKWLSGVPKSQQSYAKVPPEYQFPAADIEKNATGQ